MVTNEAMSGAINTVGGGSAWALNSSGNGNTGTGGAGAVSPSRRKLPKTPQNLSTGSEGEILVQVNVDEARKELIVTLICSKSIRQPKYPCYAQVRILPDL